MFEAIEATLYPIVCSINEYLSSYILVFLLIGVGLWYSIRTRFVQVRCFGEGMRKVFGNLKLHGGKQNSGMTSFQALATAIAAQVGTGNIVGASGAILTGGPGAIFWMWIIAFFGMATIYAEATLAQKTRIVEPDGSVKGGPVYYITTAFKGGFGKFLAGFFAVCHHPRPRLYGLHGAVELHRFDHEHRLRRPVVGFRCDPCADLRFHLPRRRAASGVRDGEGRPRDGGDLPAGRPCDPRGPHQVRPCDVRHDLQVRLPAAGHPRRRSRLCPQDRHQPGCQARPVLQ